jgi:sterol 3beta-glucosyltransferase
VHVTILTVGSRGDVQSYLALAGGLRQAGYQVRVATHRPFQVEVHQRDLEFRPVEGNPRQLLESEAGLAWLEAGRNPPGRHPPAAGARPVPCGPPAGRCGRRLP